MEQTDYKGQSLTTTSGRPINEQTREITESGQQRDYVILADDERAKGFVRPVRTQYRHVGRLVKGTLRDLTDEERERTRQYADYVKFEEYPESESPVTGRYWTQDELDRKPCNAVTTMARSIAETWARDIHFYGKTFCAICREHLPVEEFVWEGGQERMGT